MQNVWHKLQGKRDSISHVWMGVLHEWRMIEKSSNITSCRRIIAFPIYLPQGLRRWAHSACARVFARAIIIWFVMSRYAHTLTHALRNACDSGRRITLAMYGYRNNALTSVKGDLLHIYVSASLCFEAFRARLVRGGDTICARDTISARVRKKLYVISTCRGELS